MPTTQCADTLIRGFVQCYMLMASIRKNTKHSAEGTSDVSNIFIADTTDTDSDIVMDTSTFRMCMDHQEEKLLYFCDDHQTDCCAMCIINEHNKCAFVALHDIYFKFTISYRRVKHIRHDIEEAEEDLRLFLKRLDSHFALGEKKIKNAYDAIRQKINEAEKLTMQNYKKRKELEMSRVSSYFSDCETLKMDIEDILKEAKRLHENIVAPRVLYVESLSDKKSAAVDISSASETDKQGTNETLMVDKFCRAYENELASVEERLDDLKGFDKDINVNFIKPNAETVSNLETNLSQIITILPLCPVKEFVADGKLTCTGSIRSMTMVPNTVGEMMLVTYSPHKLQHINSKGTIIKQVDLQGDPYDLCLYGSNVAVSLMAIGQIKIYRLSNFSDHSQMNTPEQFMGICRVQDKFYGACYNSGIVKSINESGTVIDVSGQLFSQPSYVRYFSYYDFVLVSSKGNHQVVALSKNLKTVLFNMSHSALQSPFGLCTNGEDGFYVCSYGGHCIVEFTSDGKYVATVLSNTQGIAYPYALCYNRRSRSLAVAANAAVIQMFRAN